MIVSLLVAVVPLLWGRRLLHRALPKQEHCDLLRLVQRRQWQATQLKELAGPIGDFVREVFAEPSIAGRVDLVCERLAAVDAETRQFPMRLRMLGRTVLATGGFISILLVGEALRVGASERVLAAVFPAVACAVSAVICFWMGRLFSSQIQDRRRAWDSLSQSLVVPHMPGPHIGGDVPDCSTRDSCRTPEAVVVP